MDAEGFMVVCKIKACGILGRVYSCDHRVMYIQNSLFPTVG